MKIVFGMTAETWEELAKRPTALKGFIGCIERNIDAYDLCKDADLCKFYHCGPKAIFDNAELINKALAERGE